MEFTSEQLLVIEKLVNDAINKATGKTNVLKSVPDFGKDKDWKDKDVVKATFTEVAESFNPGTHHIAGETITRDWFSIKNMGKKGIVVDPEFVKEYEYVDPNEKFKK